LPESRYGWQAGEGCPPELDAQSRAKADR